MVHPRLPETWQVTWGAVSSSAQSWLVRGMQALGSGIMNKEKAEQLAEMRDKMGLSKEAAEKIIKGVQNQHLIGNLQVRPFNGAFSKPEPRSAQCAGCKESAVCA